MKTKFSALILTFALFLSLFNIGVSATDANLELDDSDIPFFLPVGNTFELPIKMSSVSGLYSYNLEITFNKELISAEDIEPASTNGIEGLGLIDNDNGKITYWYSYNGYTPYSGTITTLKFKVLKQGDARIEVLSSSDFVTKIVEDDFDDIDVNYADAKVTIPVGFTTLLPPEFPSGSREFTSNMIVRFKTRTDGAKIYYTTYNKSNVNREYNHSEGIPINRTTTIWAVAKFEDEDENVLAESDVVSATFRSRTDPGYGGGGGGGGYFPITDNNNIIIPPVTDTKDESTTSYADIADHWSKPFFESLIQKGIVSGYEDGTVKPDNQITRAEVVKMIVSALGLEPSDSFGLSFDDNGDIADWVKGYAQIAVDREIITGYEDNTFRPAQNITRQELVLIASRAFNLSSGGEKLSFDDSWKIASWAADSVSAAVNLGIITGYDDNEFKPTRLVTRGEASKIISLCIEN